MRKASRILFLWALLLPGCGASQDAQPAGDVTSASNQPVETDHYLSRQRTHNRWNRDLEPILTIQSGQTVTVETRDASDGHFSPDSTTADVATRDRDRIHPHTGPILVDGADRGDFMKIDILCFELPAWCCTA
ncbi:MAG: acetamidase/formamidase family protein, partial [Acidobacteriota bacterium]